MNSILALSLWLLAGGPAAQPWTEVRLTIFRDPYTSSDQVTVCRVRAVNSGAHAWPGRALRFEARALDGDRVVRARGTFGLVLEPYGSLETLIALPGRHARFEVAPLEARDPSSEREQKVRKKSSGHKRRRRPETR